MIALDRPSSIEYKCNLIIIKRNWVHDCVLGIRLMSSDISGSANPRGDLSSLRPSVSKDSLISKYDSIYWDEEMYAMMYGAHRIDYCGDIIYENLKPTPNHILFNGGYVTFSNKQPLYHFYLTDHQGNVRVVADGNGAVEQINHYYPFGALFGEVRGDDGQRYRYNGKELERLLALDWYDYGARWYDPVLCIWHSIDPLAGKYPNVSPYAYCHNNPICKIDPDGMDDYYSITGQYLSHEDNGTDFIIIRDPLIYELKQTYGIEWLKSDTPISEMTLTAKAYSNIFTDILSKMDGVNVNDLYNGKVSVTVWEDYGNLKATTDQYNDAKLNGDVLAQIGSYQGKQRLTAYIYPKGDEEKELFSSKYNIQNLLGVHEYIGHFKNNIGNGYRSHLRIYQSMQKHHSWIKTTQIYKNYMINLYVTTKNRIK